MRGSEVLDGHSIYCGWHFYPRERCTCVEIQKQLVDEVAKAIEPERSQGGNSTAKDRPGRSSERLRNKKARNA